MLVSEKMHKAPAITFLHRLGFKGLGIETGDLMYSFTTY